MLAIAMVLEGDHRDQLRPRPATRDDMKRGRRRANLADKGAAVAEDGKADGVQAR